MIATALPQPTLYRLRFAAVADTGEPVRFAFSDPAPSQVIGKSKLLDAPPTGGGAKDQGENLEILVLPLALNDVSVWRDGAAGWLAPLDQPQALVARAGEIQVSWRPSRVVIIAPPVQVAMVLEAVVDFAYFERELRSVEVEIASVWPEVEADTPLAYDIAKEDVLNDYTIGQRACRVLHRRIRYARIEPHLFLPPARFARLPSELGTALREVARCTERAEIADGQMEVQEGIYEMVSQRMGEFRHARQGFILETIIIVLLVAEVVLMAVELY